MRTLRNIRGNYRNSPRRRKGKEKAPSLGRAPGPLAADDDGREGRERLLARPSIGEDALALEGDRVPLRRGMEVDDDLVGLASEGPEEVEDVGRGLGAAGRKLDVPADGDVVPAGEGRAARLEPHRVAVGLPGGGAFPFLDARDEGGGVQLVQRDALPVGAGDAVARRHRPVPWLSPLDPLHRLAVAEVAVVALGGRPFPVVPAHPELVPVVDPG